MMKKRSIIAIFTLFLVIACETDTSSPPPTINYSPFSEASSEEEEDVYITYSGHNYLWEYDYVYNANKLWDLDVDLSQFYGTWESTTEKFVFSEASSVCDEFKYFEHKNNTKPKYTGQFKTFNNYTDLVCIINLDGNTWQMAVFTPFVFENSRLYLGKNKYMRFNKTGESDVET
jgi:hypothetical protein